MKILRIGPPQGRLGHQRVVLDSGTAFRVRSEDIAALGLEAEAAIDEITLARLRSRAEVAQAAAIAYRLLSIRLRSRKELIDRLRRSRIAPEAIQAVVGELEQAGLVDDQRFAEAWVRGRLALRPSGQIRLRRELVQKGIARELIDRTLGETLGEHEEGALALEVARTRLPRYRGVSRDVAYRRMAGVLQRRGFSAEIVMHVLREILGRPQHTVE